MLSVFKVTYNEVYKEKGVDNMRVTEAAQQFLTPILAAYPELNTICLFDNSCECGNEEHHQGQHHFALSLETPLADDHIEKINDELNVAWSPNLSGRMMGVVIDYNETGLFIQA